MTVKVVVVGQGYVGLPLALAAAESGHHVVGFDTDTARVEGLNSGKSPIGDISDEIVIDEIRQDSIHRVAMYTAGTEGDAGWSPERFRRVSHSSRYVKGDGKPATTAADPVGTL